MHIPHPTDTGEASASTAPIAGSSAAHLPKASSLSGDGYKLPIEEKPPGRGDPFWDHFGILVRRYPELTKLLNKRMSLGSLSG